MDGPSHRDQQPSEEEEKKEADENDDEGELNVIEIFNHKCINKKKRIVEISIYAISFYRQSLSSLLFQVYVSFPFNVVFDHIYVFIHTP
jgi:hypothetical protein